MYVFMYVVEKLISISYLISEHKNKKGHRKYVWMYKKVLYEFLKSVMSFSNKYVHTHIIYIHTYMHMYVSTHDKHELI